MSDMAITSEEVTEAQFENDLGVTTVAEWGNGEGITVVLSRVGMGFQTIAMTYEQLDCVNELVRLINGKEDDLD